MCSDMTDRSLERNLHDVFNVPQFYSCHENTVNVFLFVEAQLK